MFNQIFVKIVGVIFLCIALVFPSQCAADPIMISPTTYSPFHFVAFCANFLINVFLLIIGFLILKQKNLIRSWRFFKYVFFVTLGGAFIDLIYVVPKEYLEAFEIMRNISEGHPLKEVGQPGGPVATFMPIFALLTIASLILYNYWLSRKFFNLSKKKAILIGLIMGIFAGPISPLIYIPPVSSLISTLSATSL